MIKNRRNKSSVSNVRAIDFFCGAGGLAHGLIKSGIKVIAGVDSNINCKYPFEHNNSGAQFIHSNIEDISTRKLKTLLRGSDWKILVGCAPCQPFTIYHGIKKGKELAAENQDRNLAMRFLEQIREIRPDVVSMENVRGFAKRPICKKFVAGLEDSGYIVSHRVIDCAKYGIPQHRHRLVLLASLHGEITLPPPDPRIREKTLRQTIGHLRKVAHNGRDPKDPMHFTTTLSDLNLARIRASKPGGTWKEWPRHLLPNCYRKESGQGFTNVYGRMVWDKPSPTITGQFYRTVSGRFGHPTQDRPLTLREGALIQTFPSRYKFAETPEKMSKKNVGLLIGNAVPVKLGEIIGRCIINHIKKEIKAQ